MDTKSEEGEPGDEERDTTPLDADEQAMLEKLRAAGVTVPDGGAGRGHDAAHATARQRA